MDQIFSFISSATEQLGGFYEGTTRFWLDVSTLFVSIVFFLLMCIEAVVRISRRLADRRHRTETYWQMTSWQQMENGDWKQQPILWVNGAKYVFGTPQEYIPVLKSIARHSGDSKGNVKSVVTQMHQCARFRANARAVKGLMPDPPFKTEPAKPVQPSPIPTLDEVLASMDEYPMQTDSGPPVPMPTPHPQALSIVSSSPVARQTLQGSPSPEPIAPFPIQVSADTSPQQGILLKLKRSQKQAAMGGLIYMLDARIDVSAEARSLISKHDLGNRVIYESEARQRHVANAQGHLAGSRDDTSLLAPPSQQATGLLKTFWGLGRAAVSAARASLALRITVSSLMSGVHVECKSMEELLEAEEAIREAKETLQSYLDTAMTFDGREEIS